MFLQLLHETHIDGYTLSICINANKPLNKFALSLLYMLTKKQSGLDLFIRFSFSFQKLISSPISHPCLISKPQTIKVHSFSFLFFFDGNLMAKEE